MYLRQLYASLTTTANAAAQIQLVRSGRIRGIQWSVFADFDADGELFTVEASLVPIFQSNDNDSQGTLSAIRSRTSNTVATVGINRFFPLDIQIQANQLVYINCVLTGTGAVQAQAILHMQ